MTIIVRLEYGGMRLENDVEPGHVAQKIESMANKHGIEIGAINPFELVAATGKTRLTGQRAVFKVISKEQER